MTLATVNSISHSAAMQPQTPDTAPQMDVLMVCGCLVASIAVLCWMYQHDTTSCVAVLGLCLTWLAVYLLAEGAWPLAVVAMIWSAAAFWQWRRMTRFTRRSGGSKHAASAPNRWGAESRFGKMFGSSSVNN